MTDNKIRDLAAIAERMVKIADSLLAGRSTEEAVKLYPSADSYWEAVAREYLKTGQE